MASIKVYFATNRLPYVTRSKTYRSGIAFRSEPSMFDGTALRFGRATVEVPAGGTGKVVDVFVADEKLIPTGPSGDVKIGSKEIYDELRRVELEGDGDILFVLHGYANDFEGGLVGAAEIADRVGRSSVFAFCWPATDLAIGVNYGEARSNARTSGAAIGRAFNILVRYLNDLQRQDRFCNRKLDVIAHSMGNYALRCAVQAMRKQLLADQQVRLIDDLILVAADDDNDSLEVDDGIRPLVPYVRSVTVYHTPQDLVLQWADKVKFSPDRLGQTGPRSMSSVADTVVAVDVTNAIHDPKDGFLDHWYHRRSPIVMADIKRTLEFKGYDPGQLPGRIPDPTARRRYVLTGQMVSDVIPV